MLHYLLNNNNDKTQQHKYQIGGNMAKKYLIYGLFKFSLYRHFFRFKPQYNAFWKHTHSKH